LVVTVSSAMEQWVDEIRHWVGAEAVIWHPNYLAGGKWQRPPKEDGWTVTNWGSILHHPQDWKNRYDLIIGDESVVYKNWNAQRTRRFLYVARANKRASLWLLSGNPAPHYLDDLWPQLRLVDSSLEISLWEFRNRYCVVQESVWGFQILGNQPDAERQLRETYQDLMFTLEPQEFQGLLPDLDEQRRDIRMAPLQRRMYREMEEQFLTWLYDEQATDPDALLAPNRLAQVMRLLQLASNPALVGGPDQSPKWQALFDLPELEARQPTIVWTLFLDTADRIYKKLRTKRFRVGRLTGATLTQHRQAIVDRFQAGELDVLVAHPGVGKYGLTLPRAAAMVYLERNWDGDAYFQSQQRARVMGKTEPVALYLFRSKQDTQPTIDHVVDRMLRQRTASTERLTINQLREVWNR
jgi:SNF2 family DNA or RNA helicase